MGKRRLGNGTRLLVGATLYVCLDLLLRPSAFAGSGSLPWYPAAGVGFLLVVLHGWAGAGALFAARVLLFQLEPNPQPWSAVLIQSALLVAAFTAGAAFFRRRIARGTHAWALSRSTSGLGVLVATSLLGAALVSLPFARVYPESESFLRRSLELWVGDATGLLVVVPLYLYLAALFGRRRRIDLPPAALPAGRRKVVYRERAAFVLTLLLVISAQLLSSADDTAMVGPLLFIPALWAAARRGMAAAVGVNLVFALTLTAQTLLLRLDPSLVLESRVLLACVCMASLLVAALRARSDAGDAQYWQLLASSQDGIWRVDTSFRTLYANRRMAEILGVPPGSLVGKDALQYIAPEDRERWLATKRSRARGKTSAYELSVMHSDGSYRRVLVTGTPVIAPETGEYLGAVAIVTDVTALRREESLRRATEAERRRAETVLETIFRCSTDAMILFRAGDEAIVDVNDTWCKVTGYRREEVIGRSQKTLHIWDDPRDSARLDALLARDGQVLDFQFTFQRKLPDGTREQGRASLDARSATIEGTSYFFCVGRDITAAWRSEHERLHRQRLEDLGRLAGNVAHDFNNLLAVVGLSTELIREEVVEGGVPQLGDIDQISETVRRGRALTQRLLAFSSNRKAEVRPQDLNDLVKRAEGLIRAALGSSLALELELAAELPCVLLDTAQFDQILLNLAVNARDAMDEKGRLTITTGLLETEAGRQVALHVRDTGCGMDEATRARIFEPYFTTKEEGRGTGLGLSIVEAGVRATGGRVEVTSEVGRGTTFSLYWPEARKGALKAVEPERQVTVPQGFAVLVVEDDVMLRESLGRLLSHAGFAVTTAVDGRDALDKLEALDRAGSLPRVVVSDVRMPRIGGRRLAEVLARTRPELPVLLISAHEGDAEAVRQHPNVKGLLQKPFDSAELTAAVVQCIRDFGRTAASAAQSLG